MTDLSARALRVAMSGVVPADDPHIIADLQAKIESDAKEIAALKQELAHADYVLMRYVSHQMGYKETYKVFYDARDRIKAVLKPVDEQTVGK